MDLLPLKRHAPKPPIYFCLILCCPISMDLRSHAFSAKNGACTWDRSAGGWPPKGRSKGEQRLRFLGASGSPRMITKVDCGVLEPSRKLGQPHPDPPADPCQ